MDRTTAEKLIGDYEALLEKAVAILEPSGPPWGHVRHPEFARLYFEGDDVLIKDPNAETDYDCPVLETDEVRFPAALLFMSDEELATWRVAARREYEASEARRMADLRAANEAKERAVFEALKRKYGRQ